MTKEKISQEFSLKNRDETRNQYELMSKKHKKDCGVLNYIKHSLILVSTVTGCVSISTFAL